MFLLLQICAVVVLVGPSQGNAQTIVYSGKTYASGLTISTGPADLIVFDDVTVSGDLTIGIVTTYAPPASAGAGGGAILGGPVTPAPAPTTAARFSRPSIVLIATRVSGSVTIAAPITSLVINGSSSMGAINIDTPLQHNLIEINASSASAMVFSASVSSSTVLVRSTTLSASLPSIDVATLRFKAAVSDSLIAIIERSTMLAATQSACFVATANIRFDATLSYSASAVAPPRGSDGWPGALCLFPDAKAGNECAASGVYIDAARLATAADATDCNYGLTQASTTAMIYSTATNAHSIDGGRLVARQIQASIQGKRRATLLLMPATTITNTIPTSFFDSSNTYTITVDGYATFAQFGQLVGVSSRLANAIPWASSAIGPWTRHLLSVSSIALTNLEYVNVRVNSTLLNVDLNSSDSTIRVVGCQVTAVGSNGDFAVISVGLINLTSTTVEIRDSDITAIGASGCFDTVSVVDARGQWGGTSSLTLTNNTLALRKSIGCNYGASKAVEFNAVRITSVDLDRWPILLHDNDVDISSDSEGHLLAASGTVSGRVDAPTTRSNRVTIRAGSGTASLFSVGAAFNLDVAIECVTAAPLLIATTQFYGGYVVFVRGDSNASSFRFGGCTTTSGLVQVVGQFSSSSIIVTGCTAKSTVSNAVVSIVNVMSVAAGSTVNVSGSAFAINIPVGCSEWDPAAPGSPETSLAAAIRFGVTECDSRSRLWVSGSAFNVSAPLQCHYGPTKASHSAVIDVNSMAFSRMQVVVANSVFAVEGAFIVSVMRLVGDSVGTDASPFLNGGNTLLRLTGDTRMTVFQVWGSCTRCAFNFSAAAERLVNPESVVGAKCHLVRIERDLIDSSFVVRGISTRLAGLHVTGRATRVAVALVDVNMMANSRVAMSVVEIDGAAVSTSVAITGRTFVSLSTWVACTDVTALVRFAGGASSDSVITISDAATIRVVTALLACNYGYGSSSWATLVQVSTSASTAIITEPSARLLRLGADTNITIIAQSGYASLLYAGLLKGPLDRSWIMPNSRAFTLTAFRPTFVRVFTEWFGAVVDIDPPFPNSLRVTPGSTFLPTLFWVEEFSSGSAVSMRGLRLTQTTVAVIESLSGASSLTFEDVRVSNAHWWVPLAPLVLGTVSEASTVRLSRCDFSVTLSACPQAAGEFDLTAFALDGISGGSVVTVIDSVMTMNSTLGLRCNYPLTVASAIAVMTSVAARGALLIDRCAMTSVSAVATVAPPTALFVANLAGELSIYDTTTRATTILRAKRVTTDRMMLRIVRHNHTGWAAPGTFSSSFTAVMTDKIAGAATGNCTVANSRLWANPFVPMSTPSLAGSVRFFFAALDRGCTSCGVQLNTRCNTVNGATVERLPDVADPIQQLVEPDCGRCSLYADCNASSAIGVEGDARTGCRCICPAVPPRLVRYISYDSHCNSRTRVITQTRAVTLSMTVDDVRRARKKRTATRQSTKSLSTTAAVVMQQPTAMQRPSTPTMQLTTARGAPMAPMATTARPPPYGFSAAPSTPLGTPISNATAAPTGTLTTWLPNITTAAPTSPPMAAGPAKTSQALSSVLGSSTAGSVAAASTTSAAAVGAAASPTSATKASNLNNIVGASNCVFSSDDVQVTQLQVFVVWGVGKGSFSQLLGPIVTTLILVGGAHGLNFALWFKYRHLRGLRSAFGLLSTFFAGYLLPTTAGLATTVLVHDPALAERAIFGGGGLLLTFVMALWPAPWFLKRLPRQRAADGDELTPAKVDDGGPSHDKAAAKKEQWPGHESSLYGYKAYYDLAKGPNSPPVLLCYFEDIFVALMLSVVGSAKPDGVPCIVTAGTVALIALAHVVYLAVVRPFAELVDTVFSNVIGWAQLLLSALVAASTVTSVPDELVGYLALGLGGTFVIQSVVTIGMAIARQCRKPKKKPATSPSGSGVSAPLLMLFDTDEQQQQQAMVPVVQHQPPPPPRPPPVQNPLHRAF